MNQKVAEPRQFGELHRQGRIDRQMEDERGPVGGRVASEIEPDARQGTTRHAVHARAVAHDEERINCRAAVLRVELDADSLEPLSVTTEPLDGPLPAVRPGPAREKEKAPLPERFARVQRVEA